MNPTKILLALLLFCPLTLWATEDVDHIDVFTTSDELTVAANETFVSPVKTTDILFNAASVCWITEQGQSEQVQVAFRAQGENGYWSEWQALAASGHDVVFSGKNQAYQYRLQALGETSLQLKSLSVHYNEIYENQLTSTYEEVFHRTIRAISKPPIVSRSEWKARSPKTGYSSHSPRKLTIHHTWRPTKAQFKGAASIRQIQNYHMDSNGWNDIGYHFLIGTYQSSGTTYIYQGRPETVIGAHAGGANTNNVGVNIIGDYTTEKVHPNSYKKLIDLLAWLCYEYNINPNYIYGHRDFGNTACPGKNLYVLLPQIRADVKKRLNGGSGATGELVGLIYDAAKGTSSKLSRAVVKLHTGQSTVTDSDGLYRFKVKPGHYRISVSRSGYQSASSAETVQEGKKIWESIGLRK